MSEPTSGGTHKPDPDSEGNAGQAPGTDSGKDQDEVQDPVSDSVFNDPTAPVWADPTTPIPPMPPVPPTPPGAESPYGQQPPPSPYGQQQTPPDASPPMSNPYAQQPPAQPGQQYPAYSQQPPAQPGQYSAYSQQAYPAATPNNTSAIILTIVSALSLCNLLAVAPLVIGIIALTKNSTDPDGSRRLTKIGWIVFAAVWVVAILAFVGLVVAGVMSGNSGSGLSY